MSFYWLRSPHVGSWRVALASFLVVLFSSEMKGGVLGLPTAEVVLVGRFAKGPMHTPLSVDLAGFQANFGSSRPLDWPAELQSRQFFAQGGNRLQVIRVAADGELGKALLGESASRTGLGAIETLSDARILLMPELSLIPIDQIPAAFANVRQVLDQHQVFFIVDPPPSVVGLNAISAWVETAIPADASGAALYYPLLQVRMEGLLTTIGASGAMAAIYQQSDAQRGIWKSPSGSGWPLQAVGLSETLNSSQVDTLNARHICPLRQPVGQTILAWGARTLNRVDGDALYIPVVRTRDWIKSSLRRGLAYSAARDNNAALWQQLRGETEDFLLGLFQQQALLGAKASESFFVRCDASTTSVSDIAAHRVKVVYGLALLRPSEFIIDMVELPTFDAARPVPVPSVQAVSLSSGWRLSFPTVPGFWYQEQGTEALIGNQPAWQPIVAEMEGDGRWIHRDVPALGDQGFYRVLVRPMR